MPIVGTREDWSSGTMVADAGVAVDRFYCMMLNYQSDIALPHIFYPCTRYDDQSWEVVKLVTVDRCSP